jgi:glutaredoxin
MKVAVYSKPGCSACTDTKRWMDKWAITYIERDVTQDHEAAAVVKASGKTQLPMVDVINDETSPWELEERWHGFDILRIRRLVTRGI